jgi:hypothetical protein
MKRHGQLLELSRDHHAALVLAVHAQRAAASGESEAVAAAAADCRDAFDAELDAHFALEENDLLPLLLAAGEGRLAQRLTSEHARLRGLRSQLREPDAVALRAFGEVLTAHVRFEEREMFITLEGLLEP